MQNRVNIPILCQQVAPARHLLDLLRTVTAGVFKTLLGKIYHEARILAR